MTLLGGKTAGSCLCFHRYLPKGEAAPYLPSYWGVQHVCSFQNTRSNKNIFVMQEENLPPIECYLLKDFFPHFFSRKWIAVLGWYAKILIRNNTSRRWQMLAVMLWHSIMLKPVKQHWSFDMADGVWDPWGSSPVHSAAVSLQELFSDSLFWGIVVATRTALDMTNTASWR